MASWDAFEVEAGGEPLEEAAEDGFEKPKAMLELPDVVFRLVCRFLDERCWEMGEAAQLAAQPALAPRRCLKWLN